MSNLLREIYCKEGDPPPIPAVYPPQIVVSPVLSSSPPPLLSPKVAMSEPDAPRPCQRNHSCRSRRICDGRRMRGVKVHEHHRDHGPVEIDQLLAGQT